MFEFWPFMGGLVIGCIGRILFDAYVLPKYQDWVLDRRVKRAKRALGI